MDAIIEPATCLGCGCLCDDIRVEVEAGRVVETGHACPVGRSWFLAPRPGEGHPPATVDARAVDFALAVDRAAAILGRARVPVVWGLSGSTVEGVASALAIADALGAVVNLAGPAARSARLRAFQRVGMVSATLGEVKDRADVVVFWGVDPVATHPRHWERYSVEPRGRFVPDGRAGRSVIVVNATRTATGSAADLFVAIDPGRRGEALGALRAIVRGVAIDPGRVESATGLPFADLENLAGRLMGARYGAFFSSTGSAWEAESAALLVRDLNRGRRFVGLAMGEPGNPGGAEAVLGWQAGAASAVNYGRGFPRHLPDEATLADRLRAGEVNAALIVADDPADHLPADLRAALDRIPTVRIAPGATDPGRTSAVAFDVARPGIESGGTVARVDGVMLPLRPAIQPALPTDREVLDRICARLNIL